MSPISREIPPPAVGEPAQERCHGTTAGTGCQPEDTQQNGDTPLLRIISQYGSSKEAAELVDLLVKKDINAANNDGRTPLMAAIGSGNRAIVEKLITGVPMSMRKALTRHLIAAASRAELLRLLLENKADPNLSADNGQTALDQATRAGNLEAVRLLLDAGARVEPAQIGRDGPLHGAAANGSTEMIQLLLMKGADASGRGQGGRTLHALRVAPAPARATG